MNNFEPIKPPSVRRLVAIVAVAFLMTFVISRLTVYLVLGHLMPNFFLTVRGVHIHHFTYGVVILVVVGFALLIKRLDPNARLLRWLAFFYGVGLGLTFDEFGMWIRLQDDYWVRQSYDMIIVISLLFLNILLFPTIKSIFLKEIKRLVRLFRKKVCDDCTASPDVDKRS